MNVVAVAAAIEPTMSTIGRLSMAASRNGPTGMRAVSPKKRARDGIFTGDRAVREHSDESASVERALDLEHRIDAAERDDTERQPRIDRFEHGVQLPPVVFVEHHDYVDAARVPAERADRLEASEVSAEHETAVAACGLFLGQPLVERPDREAAVLAPSGSRRDRGSSRRRYGNGERGHAGQARARAPCAGSCAKPPWRASKTTGNSR